MTGHVPELLRAHDEVLGGLGESHNQAAARAYHNRTAIRSVSMDIATHGAISEAYQAWAEYRASRVVGLSQSAPRRLPDGRAPGVTAVYGYPVYVDDTVNGTSWNTGPDPVIEFDTSLPGAGS